MADDYDEQFFDIDQILMEEEMNHAESILQYMSSNEENEENAENEENDETFFMPEHVDSNTRSRWHRPHLKLKQRRSVVDCILVLLEQEHFPRGSVTKLANKFGVHRSTISRIFKEFAQQRGMGELIDVSCKKLGKVGPKRKEYPEEWLQLVSLHKRTTVRSFVGALKISNTNVHRLKKDGKPISHTSNNHHRVTHKNKLLRMQWVLSQIIPRTPSSPPTFNDMKNTIHTDEKWFYINPETRRFYLLPKEDEPYRCEQSKKFKVKVMFMGVISRSIYDDEGNMKDIALNFSPASPDA